MSRMKRILILDLQCPPPRPPLPSASLPLGSESEEPRRSRCERARTPPERSAAQISDRSAVHAARCDLPPQRPCPKTFCRLSVADQFYCDDDEGAWACGRAG